MIRIVIGSLILLGVFAGIFSAMAKISGWRVAAAVWAVASAFTAVIVLAVWLITGSWS